MLIAHYIIMAEVTFFSFLAKCQLYLTLKVFSRLQGDNFRGMETKMQIMRERLGFSDFKEKEEPFLPDKIRIKIWNIKLLSYFSVISNSKSN